MGCGQALAIGKGERELVGQAEVQRFVGVEEGTGGCPDAGNETQQGDGEGHECGTALRSLIFRFG